jgi:hypothetical protein
MWVSRPFWTGTENLVPTGVRILIQRTYHTKFAFKQQMTDGLPVTVVISHIVSEAKVITRYQFWGALHEYGNYNY